MQVAGTLEERDGAIWAGPELKLPSGLKVGDTWKAFTNKPEDERCAWTRKVETLSEQKVTVSGSEVCRDGPSASHWPPLSTETWVVGRGLVRFDALNAAALAFHVSGAGDGQLAGQVGDLNLSVSGKGKLMAEQLRATHATVSISGIGNAQLWVTDSLRVGISGVGNIDYWGRPEVTRSTSGLGSVNSLGDKR